MAEPEVRRTLPLWLIVVLGVAGTAVAIWGIRAAAPILGPVVLAFVLTVTVHPLVGALVRRGVRQGLAVAVAVLVVNGGLIAFALALFVSIGQLATVLPAYSDEWQHMLDGLRSALAGAGIGRQQVEQALHSVQLGTVVSALGSVLSRTALAVGALVLVLATVVFMAVDATGMPERLAEVPGTSRLRGALDDFARNTRRYLVATTVFGFAVAVVDTIALVVLGIPLALLWGLLSFLTNYVPNIGFFLGLAPPTILALLVGGPGTAVLVVVIYIVVNFVLQSVIQPLVVGDVVGLSVTLTFLSVIVWTVVLGPLGAVLAIPLTLLVVAVLVAQDPDRRWARTLLAGASGADRGGKRPAKAVLRRGRDRRSVPTPRGAGGGAEPVSPAGPRAHDHDVPASGRDAGGSMPASASAEELQKQPDREDGA
jgi:predicted PurR-regulated permease PerM